MGIQLTATSIHAEAIKATVNVKIFRTGVFFRFFPNFEFIA